MAKRRRAVAVVLTPEQRKRLENLWFVYGNYGPKTTKGNHSFIQGLLERGEDERPLRMKGYIPTAECELAVDQILTVGQGKQTRTDRHEDVEEANDDPEGRLRLVPTEPQKHFSIDPHMKAIIEEINERRKEKERLSPGEPDAA